MLNISDRRYRNAAMVGKTGGLVYADKQHSRHDDTQHIRHPELVSG